ncbi:MAG: zinc ribbon domain-containing protein [Thiomargarita sp.]|nr:zinc ribbon domain-containing protein [Thiomargarita sp.]
MPIYEYEHVDSSCVRGKIFEFKQSINDPRLRQCPTCNGILRKRISQVAFSIPKTNTDYRNLGFTKLVKRDNGVYENMTRRDGESRYMVNGKPETAPDFSKTIND